jgi:hypothetical protein
MRDVLCLSFPFILSVDGYLHLLLRCKVRSADKHLDAMPPSIHALEGYAGFGTCLKFFGVSRFLFVLFFDGRSSLLLLFTLRFPG